MSTLIRLVLFSVFEASMIGRLLKMTALLAAGLLGALPARADVEAYARIHWNTFHVQLVDLSGGSHAPVFEWLDDTLSGAVHSYALTVEPYAYEDFSDSAANLSDELSVSARTAMAQATALRGGTILSAFAARQPGTSSSESDHNHASAGAYNVGQFEVSGHGIALITVGWEFGVTGNVDDWNDNAYAAATVQGDYTNGTHGSAWSGGWAYSAEQGTMSQSGTFSMAIFNSGTGTTRGSLWASADAQAGAQTTGEKVPEPASWMLLGLGLVGWGARRRWRA